MPGNYCVMTMAKRHRSDVRGLQKEANRQYEDKSKYKNKVDLSRTDENYYFVKSDDWNESIDDVLEANGIKERRDSVVLITSVYALSPEWLQKHKEEEAMEYFKKCFKFEQKHKGEVINAVIHKDETSLHMQVATVPILQVQDTVNTPVLDADGNVAKDKKGRTKYKKALKVDDNNRPVYHTGLSAKTVFGNKVKMSKMQTQFWEECGKELGLERGEIRIEDDEEAKKRLTEAQYQAEQIVKDAKNEKDVIYAEARFNAQKEADEANDLLRKELRKRKAYMESKRIKLKDGTIITHEENYQRLEKQRQKAVKERVEAQESKIQDIAKQDSTISGRSAIEKAMSGHGF